MVENAETANPTPPADAAPSGAVAAASPAVATPADAATPEAAPAPRPRRELTASNPWFWGTGRRKTAVARVRLRPGTGVFKVQIKRVSKKDPDSAFKDVNSYFPEERDRGDVIAPLRETNTLGSVDIFVRLHGGGLVGQAGALVLGVARALKDFDPNLEPILREHGFLTRDARRVERKKYGQKGARAKFQFSKR